MEDKDEDYYEVNSEQTKPPEEQERKVPFKQLAPPPKVQSTVEEITHERPREPSNRRYTKERFIMAAVIVALGVAAILGLFLIYELSPSAAVPTVFLDNFNGFIILKNTGVQYEVVSDLRLCLATNGDIYHMTVC